jgi:hypothetical protein
MNEPVARLAPVRLIVALLLFLLAVLLAAREWAGSASRGPAVRQAIAEATLHPEPLRKRLLLDSSVAAISGGRLDDDARSRMLALARLRPLASEPFLLAGASAQTSGDWAAAERLYMAARIRDPRSPAARYLLADLYFRTGRPRPGLAEMLTLFRLEPRAAAPLGPALARYARQPGAAELLAPLVAADVVVSQAMLETLAEDPANAELILRLSPPRRPGEPLRTWEQRLLDKLVGAGEFDRAERLWERLYGNRRDGPVTNPRFRNGRPMPPFDWTLYTGPAGVVEVGERGGLTVLHHGREAMVAARQLVRLPPGRYVLRVRATAPSGNSRFQWKLICVGGKQLASVPLRAAGAALSVPAGCPAQWLDLAAEPAESGQPSETRVHEVAIDGAGR